MFKTVFLLKVTTRNFMLIEHYGILVEEEGAYFVYHNDNESENNPWGGDLYREPLNDFLQGRELLDQVELMIDINQLYQVYFDNITRNYNLKNWNCEHFVLKVLTGSARSPQLVEWGSKFLTIGLVSYLGWRWIRSRMSE